MAESMTDWLNGLGCPPELAIFIISLFPILELRGGLIAASLMNISIWKAFPICFIGNVLPIPFILIFIKKIFELMKKWGPTEKIVTVFERRANKNAAKAENKTHIGRLIFVFAFVAIPLPGTGGWTGALVASFMNMKLKHSIPTIILGVFCAGIIMTILAYVAPALIGLKVIN